MSTRIPGKVFNDPVHGHIELPPLCIKIIDTPQFQRLRDIKQLSFCSYVYPGGIHSRFEHSLGTCFLAGELVKHFQEDTELGITAKDILCVEIAALCHDLGHGPFSHLWEQFMNRVNPSAEWKHENTSVEMLHYLIEENNLKDAFHESFGDQCEKYMTFIKLQISGSADDRQNQPWKLPEEDDKSFLYEVVSNKETGMDVDKWDYIERDCYHIGFKHNFTYDRIIKFSRIIKSDHDGRKRICFQEKELLNLHNMYQSRFILHSRVYHHNISKIIEYMVLEALELANENIVYKNGDKSLNMCDATLHLKLFSTMTDSIFQKIMYSNEEELKPARIILQRIHARNLYKFVGEMRLKPGEDAEDLKKKVIRNIPEKFLHDVVCLVKKVGYGMEGKNPMLDTYFFQKSTPTNARRIDQDEMSKFVPKCGDCEEKYALFFCHSSDENVFRGIKKGFDQL